MHDVLQHIVIPMYKLMQFQKFSMIKAAVLMMRSFTLMAL